MVKSTRTAPRRKSAGRKAGARTPARSVSVKREASSAVSHAMEAVMASLAHEIRTPLTGILAISELLAMSDLGERERVWVEVLRGSAEHMNALASLVIDGVRAKEKGLALRRDRFDPGQIARAAAASLAARAQVKGLRSAVTIADDLPAATIGDPVRLRAAVENLVDNAVKFTESGDVRLDVSHGGELMSFAVTDSGIGLSTAEIKRLFRPFAQGSDKVGERFGGAGLGLAFVKRIAQAMGGDVTVTSSPGKGSLFRLTVALEPAESASAAPDLAPPRSPAAAEAQPAKSAAAKRASTKPAKEAGHAALQILCAEDNVYGRIITKTILAELGHKVRFVGSGAAVVEAVNRNDYDAVLMDVVLSGLDGIEATRRIRMLPGRAGRVPVIGLSGHGTRDNEAKARAAGMDGYLRKPVTPRALADMLEQVARRR